MAKRALAPELNPGDEIQFLACHRVSVPAGDYTINVQQNIGANKTPEFNPCHKFSVLPERFELSPRTIHAVFPPAASRGDFQADLPHVILDRSTLPWERTAKILKPAAGDEKRNMEKDPPWLGLLLFHQDEANDLKVSTVKLSGIADADSEPVFFPAPPPESGQHDNDQVRVIDVPKKLLVDILPTDLDYHAHARRRLAIMGDSSADQTRDVEGAKAVLEAAGVHLSESATPAKIKGLDRWHFRDAAQHAEYEVWYNAGEEPWSAYRVDLESAVVLGNRLPKPGGRNVVHLVSLEGRYRPESKSYSLRRLAILGDSSADQTRDVEGAKAVLEAAGVHLSESATPAKIKGLDRWHFRDAAQHAEYEVWYNAGEEPWSAYRVDLESAVVLGNRLPKPGGRNVVRLVSLEGRYRPESKSYSFNFQEADENDLIRLVSLHSWEFFCENPAHTFTGLLESLNWGYMDVVDGNLPSASLDGATIDASKGTIKKDTKEIAKITSGDWSKATSVKSGLVLDSEETRLEHLNGTIRLETNQASSSFGLPATAAGDNEPAASYLRAGLVPLRHFFRQGDRSVSWYHGPLVPEEPAEAKACVMLPASGADELIMYDGSTHMFDVSYAAAWELGRMLTLQNRKVALSLFNWKRRHAAVRKSPETGFTFDSPRAQDSFPTDVDKWLHELSLLVHVPFHYLAPDERLLPPESIRFFDLDPVWLECLCDGAFNIGRVLKNDHAQDKITQIRALAEAVKNGSAHQGDHAGMTGCLLRSEVVSGWPGLRVDASPKPLKHEEPMNAKLPLLRMERLSKNVMICLFDGDVLTLDIHLRPETLHFGFDWDGNRYSKKPRDSEGRETGEPWFLDKDSVPSAKRILSFNPNDGLPSLIQKRLKSTSLSGGFVDSGPVATFALQMVAGVQLVRFLRPAKTA